MSYYRHIQEQLTKEDIRWLIELSEIAIRNEWPNELTVTRIKLLIDKLKRMEKQ